MLIKSVELNIIIGWSSKFMEVKSIVMQFRGIMTAAIVVFICREPSVDDAIGSIMQEVNKNKFKSFNFFIL